MSIKLGDGKWYLIESEGVRFVCAYNKESNVLEYKWENLCIKAFSTDVTIISEMTPVKQQEPEYEFVKVELERAWIAAKNHEERTIELWRQSDLNDAINGNNWKAIQSPSEAAQYHFDLYRRVKVDKRQKFIDECIVRFGKVTTDSKCIYETIYDELVK